MKTTHGLIIAILTLAFPGGVHAQSDTPNLLEDALWTHRLLVICRNDASGSLADKLKIGHQLQAYHERDLVIVTTEARTQYAHHLRKGENGKMSVRVRHIQSESEQAAIKRKAACQADRHSIALIGKDGGLKRVWTDTPTYHDVFDIIDAMPMRRQEMRDKVKAKE